MVPLPEPYLGRRFACPLPGASAPKRPTWERGTKTKTKEEEEEEETKSMRRKEEQEDEEGEQNGQRSLESLFGASWDISWALLGGILVRLGGLLTVLEGSWSS